jgi:sporadic carbohydrate cluster 2OG-Fe(II) oxygenase
MNYQHNFLSADEVEVSKEYQKQGYIVRTIKDRESLEWMRDLFIKLVRKNTALKIDISDHKLLDFVHNELDAANLNDFRLSIIKQMNATDGFKQRYYQIAKPYLDKIVGNELAMQSNVNLSIQFPNDDSSLLATHADTWSGDSPFEVVVWVPLVDCYKTKSMYLLPPEANTKLNNNFKKMSGNNSNDLFKSIEPNIEWIKINYGEVMLFNQSLPHGNRVNKEDETRWSMNCRFKSLFSPYGDKKIGEFFEPITTKPASITGFNYQHPDL